MYQVIFRLPSLSESEKALDGVRKVSNSDTDFHELTRNSKMREFIEIYKFIRIFKIGEANFYLVSIFLNYARKNMNSHCQFSDDQ